MYLKPIPPLHIGSLVTWDKWLELSRWLVDSPPMLHADHHPSPLSARTLYENRSATASADVYELDNGNFDLI